MKYIRIISNLIIFTGVMIIAGTAGASDLGEITLFESVSRVLLGFSVISFGKMIKAVSGLKLRKISDSKIRRVKFFQPDAKVGEVKLGYKKAG